MAYVHTAPFRTAAFAQGVDGARLVIRHDRAVIPPGELIPSLGGLGEPPAGGIPSSFAAGPSAAPAASGTGWGSIVGIAQAVLPAIVQGGFSMYSARQQKKDLARQEDLAREDANRAQQALMAQRAAMANAAPAGFASGIPGGTTTLIVAGAALAGLLILAVAMRR